MNRRIKHFFKIINEDLPLISQRKEKISFYIFIGFAAAFYCLVIMILNVINHKFRSVSYMLLIILLYLSTSVAAMITKKTIVSNIIYSGIFLVFVTLAFVLKGNDGIGTLWFFILSPLILFIAGSNFFFILGIAFLVISLVCCYIPPMRQFMLQRYTLTFLNLYPIVYLLDFILLFLSIYQYHKNLLFQNQIIVEMKEKEESMISKNLNSILRSLINVVNSIEEKEDIAGKHSMRVADFSKRIALKLGWDEEQANQLYNVALLHDIGKISIPEEILRKPESLTPEEHNKMRNHTSYGAEILQPLENLPEAYLVAKHHHERYDGKGYPSHLAGTNIPIEARIVTLANAFDSMNYSRPYREACDVDYIRNQLETGRGTQFDPNLVDLFIPICEENKWFRE